VLKLVTIKKALEKHIDISKEFYPFENAMRLYQKPLGTQFKKTYSYISTQKITDLVFQNPQIKNLIT
jgi:hypothetical protein